MTDTIYNSPESDVAQSREGLDPLTLKQVLFSFRGRIPRSTYWYTFLGLMGVMMVLMMAPVVLGLGEAVMGLVIVVLYVPAVWISLAIQVKRWHDRDKSGWWVLISFIPIIGPIWAFIENGCLAGTVGENRFGLPSK